MLSYLYFFIINCQQKIIQIIKAITNKGKIDDDQYKKIHPVDSQPGILYGLAKVHKKVVDGFPPFRPIFSAIGTPAYKIA